jgi:hypothetical protein
LPYLDGTAKIVNVLFPQHCQENNWKTLYFSLNIIYKHFQYPTRFSSDCVLKFTFAVVYNKISFQVVEKELFVKSVIASHGRDLFLPSPKLKIPMHLSTLMKLLATVKQSVSPSTTLSKLLIVVSPDVSQIHYVCYSGLLLTI